ncbi:hypothetical protein SAMN04487898_104305 [Pedobacter sp. ok626]|nr:hypothetical protein SAMN04487898_104305 [Pedobacter sp. ok626]
MDRQFVAGNRRGIHLNSFSGFKLHGIKNNSFCFNGYDLQLSYAEAIYFYSLMIKNYETVKCTRVAVVLTIGFAIPTPLWVTNG